MLKRLALIEAATVEEEPDLKVVWAALLASAVDADETPVEKSFVSILAVMSATDVRALSHCCAGRPLKSEEKEIGGDGIIYAPALDRDLYGQWGTQPVPARPHRAGYQPFRQLRAAGGMTCAMATVVTGPSASQSPVSCLAWR